MKRVFATLFLLTYLLTASGLVFNLHYCGGELNSIQLVFSQKEVKRCPCGSKKMAKDCCKDTKLVIKVKDVHKSSANAFSLKAPTTKLLAIATPAFEWNSITPNYTQLSCLYANAPPDCYGNTLFLLNCNFRI